MVNIHWSELALEDLKSIHDYIAQNSKVYADRFIAKILERVEQLENFPELGRKLPEFSQEYIRELIEGNYRIVYLIDNDKNIGISRIHHASRLLTNS